MPGTTEIKSGVRESDSGRYTAGQLETDIRRITRRLRANNRMASTSEHDADRDTAEIAALHRVVVATEMMIDRHITLARRRERRDKDGTVTAGEPVTWKAIGSAMGLSGRAAANRANRHHLPVTQLTNESYAAFVAAGRATCTASTQSEITSDPQMSSCVGDDAGV